MFTANRIKKIFFFAEMSEMISCVSSYLTKEKEVFMSTDHSWKTLVSIA
jgi:hypothetical protein